MTDLNVRESIALFGAGGHARSVHEVIRRQARYRIAVVLDDDARPGRTLAGHEVEDPREVLPVVAERDIRLALVAIGANRDRAAVVERLRDAGLEFGTVIDPTAVLGRDVEVGPGSVLMPGVVVNVGTKIGAHAILNTACSVDHDCDVGSGAHLSPGVRVSGGCRIGAGVHLGIGSSVIQEVEVGDGATVGAGAAVVGDVEAGTIVAGVPARPVGVRSM